MGAWDVCPINQALPTCAHLPAHSAGRPHPHAHWASKGKVEALDQGGICACVSACRRGVGDCDAGHEVRCAVRLQRHVAACVSAHGRGSKRPLCVACRHDMLRSSTGLFLVTRTTAPAVCPAACGQTQGTRVLQLSLPFFIHAGRPGAQLLRSYYYACQLLSLLIMSPLALSSSTP